MKIIKKNIWEFDIKSLHLELDKLSEGEIPFYLYELATEYGLFAVTILIEYSIRNNRNDILEQIDHLIMTTCAHLDGAVESAFYLFKVACEAEPKNIYKWEHLLSFRRHFNSEDLKPAYLLVVKRLLELDPENKEALHVLYLIENNLHLSS
jgi:hypothetical protein